MAEDQREEGRKEGREGGREGRSDHPAPGVNPVGKDRERV